MVPSSPPSITTKAAQTTPTDPPPLPPTPAPALEKDMAHDISDADDVRSFDIPDSDLPPLPADDDDSFLQVNGSGDGAVRGDESVMTDREMKRQLEDLESSFLPEASVQVDATQGLPGADDTYLFGGSPGHSQSLSQVEEEKKSSGWQEPVDNGEDGDSSMVNDEPPTPADAYKTPAARRSDVDTDDSIITGDSASEAMPSSPSAEAARRNRSRGAQEDAPIEEMVERSDASEAQASDGAQQQEQEDTRRPASSASTVKAPDFASLEENSSFTEDHDMSMESLAIPVPSVPTATTRIGQRPSFLQHRQSSHRSSISSFTNHSDVSLDGGSSGSLGADFALQSGGAVPRSSDQSRPSSIMLSRLPSLGSIASSASGYSDSNPWDKTRSISTHSLSGLLHPENQLGRLEEETHSSTTPPETPRAPSAKPIAPTDTVITRHVQDIQVPDTIAREFREKHGRSPEKRHMATPFTRNKHNLTLKEQNSKIDKLSKENFDLKLKIHFLDQALQNRSDENVKETISKNVQLQTDLANEKKDNLSLRKKVRDLERRLKAQEEGVIAHSPSNESEGDNSDISERHKALEDEIEFLRERLVSTETTVESWKQEVVAKDADNRRIMEYIRNMREKGSSENSTGVDEAIHILTEDFEEERNRREQAEARFEQADAERQQLRDEVQRLQEQNQYAQQHSLTNNHVKHVFSSRKIYTSHTTRSNSGSDVNEQPAATSMGGTSGTLVEHLQTDNEKLQRDLHAQASMLTSRNRENLRLREENEGLKLTIRRGDVASTAGDSILERSISRNHVRSVSRASHATRMSQISDPERDRDRDREDLESKCAALRDELSQVKLQYKELDDQLNGHLDLLEQTEGKVQELQRELDAHTEDLQALSIERDEILEGLQEKDQECEDVRQQALETIQRLESEIEQKEQECNRLVTDLENITEDFNALQQEMKNVSESLLQLEDDRDASLRKIQNLEAELDDANQELGRQDKLLSDEKSKNERLEIQIESCQGEIDFLREEQEGDKIKIGELESTLNGAHVTVQDEKERFRNLEERVAEERHQRDVLDNQEKQEVEKVITDLNSQVAKMKEDNRKLRKNLSGKEVEATQWKQRLDELESNLREALGNLNGTRTSMLKVPTTITVPTKHIFNAIVQDVHKLQHDLEATMQELDNTRQDLAEKDRLLRNRDALLESTGLESRRLSDMLERERQARRQEQAAFENAKRGHQSITRTIQQHETKVVELESMRSQDRQKLFGLEKQYREQLLERNNLLYALWNRLSTLCGAEWSRSHSLIGDELPSLELISKNIQGFNKNIILAVKTVEGIIGGFRQRIRNLEKDLTRDYQTLEHTLDVRIKRVDQLEKLVRAQRDSIGRPSTIRGGVVELNNQEVTKLRNENKTLRTEVSTLRAITATTNVVQEASRSASRAGSPSSSKRASMAQTLLRHHSTSAVEGLSNPPDHPYPQAGPLQPSEQKWIHRLKELERRLKAEREARLLDRSGARKRLEQKVEENADLRALLERERDRKESEGGMVEEGSGSGSRSGSKGPEEDVY
jgi:chromosome segregation ATPase